MSTPGLPPVHRVEPATNPSGGGLYGAATIVDLDDPARLSGGADLESANQGAHGRWPSNCADTEGLEKGGDGDCSDLVPFPATVVWASDERKTVGVSDEDARLAAAQTLRLSEGFDVGQHLAPQLIAAAGTPATAEGEGGDALVAALGAVEAAPDRDLPLVIHAPRRAAALAASKGLIVRRGERLETPLGNRWAFGSGYQALAGVLVATGPVTILRSPVVTNVAVDLATNVRQVIAEREIVAYWDGPAYAAAYTTGGGPTLPGEDTLPGDDTLPET